MNNQFHCKQCDKIHARGHVSDRAKDNPDSVAFCKRVIENRDSKIAMQSLQIAQLLMEKQDLIKKFALPTDSAELIIGYRMWGYHEGKLQSAYKTQFTWPFRKPMQKDVYEDAGIHSVKTFKQCIPLLKHYCPTKPTAHDPGGELIGRIGVVGAVYLWGKVDEHELGYLSEYAYPKELYVSEEMDVMNIMELEYNYGVPVTARLELNRDRVENYEDPSLSTWVQYTYPAFTYVVNSISPAWIPIQAVAKSPSAGTALAKLSDVSPTV